MSHPKSFWMESWQTIYKVQSEVTSSQLFLRFHAFNSQLAVSISVLVRPHSRATTTSPTTRKRIIPHLCVFRHFYLPL